MESFLGNTSGFFFHIKGINGERSHAEIMVDILNRHLTTNAPVIVPLEVHILTERIISFAAFENNLRDVVQSFGKFAILYPYKIHSSKILTIQQGITRGVSSIGKPCSQQQGFPR